MAVTSVRNTLVSDNSKTNRVNKYAKVVATGGSTADSGGYRVHTYTSTSTFNVVTGGSIEIFAIGGGAGGGHGQCGQGGGAGGVQFTPNAAVTSGASYTITVGNFGGTQTGGGTSSVIGTGLSISAGGGGIPTSGSPDSFSNSPGGAGAGGDRGSAISLDRLPSDLDAYELSSSAGGMDSLGGDEVVDATLAVGAADSSDGSVF